MGKTRDLFKKKKKRERPRENECKDGTIKNRNCMDLSETEEVSKIHRRPVYTKNTQKTKKGLHDPDNHEHLPTARHPRMQSQVGLRNHPYEQS